MKYMSVITVLSPTCDKLRRIFRIVFIDHKHIRCIEKRRDSPSHTCMCTCTCVCACAVVVCSVLNVSSVYASFAAEIGQLKDEVQTKARDLDKANKVSQERQRAG